MGSDLFGTGKQARGGYAKAGYMRAGFGPENTEKIIFETHPSVSIPSVSVSFFA